MYSSSSGGWAEWGLMQHCTPSALERQRNGWVIQWNEHCSPEMRINLSMLSIFCLILCVNHKMGKFRF